MKRRHAKKAAETKGKEYIVLILLSDCCIVDQVETARLIVEISLCFGEWKSPWRQGSELPLSIIILGMGENDFHFMEILDGDMKKLEYDGKVAKRDVERLEAEITDRWSSSFPLKS